MKTPVNNRLKYEKQHGPIESKVIEVPDNKEEVNLNNIRFVVEEVDKNRIKKVRIYT